MGSCWKDVADFGSCESVIDHTSLGTLQIVQESTLDLSKAYGIDMQTCLSFIITGAYGGTRACGEI